MFDRVDVISRGWVGARADFSALCFARMVVGFGLGGVPVAYNFVRSFYRARREACICRRWSFFGRSGA